MYRSHERTAERIRQDRKADPYISVSDLVLKYRVSRNAVRGVLGLPPEPAQPRPSQRRPLLLDPVRGLIDDMLCQEHQDHGVRLSHRKILQRLEGEAGFEAVSLSTLRNYVRKRRPEIQAEQADVSQRMDGHELCM
ncbi:hypothetical protein ACFC96_31680 [Streptomyces sp. NPDC055955]|uniref:hypothetical protein n=1 Tax=Streptomyces sp. NPDC055955 TaxID=3345665 RepID=UPI0035D8FAB8